MTTNTVITVDQALMGLYTSTRKAPLPLDEHDRNRQYVDVLAQALNLSVKWVVPNGGEAEQPKEQNVATPAATPTPDETSTDESPKYIGLKKGKGRVI